MRWPCPETVVAAAREWAERLASAVPAVTAVGYFGSYARGDWTVGSDLDLVAVIAATSAPRRRDDVWGVERLPVPAELLVYATEEWRGLRANSPRFYQTLQSEARWLIGAPPSAD